ncbi:phage virion morphogenesis protein [Paraburkholderia sp. NMBU_R16]|uniref:phage virion morphogenesis protein n=1 Tax=Paraburkholderia sp. NMBU_R16 TaxID=2698676 RepID=UPI0015664113|nr:phage virion morphogenesis protein [Paraburkholderia sp. NMBU_R16]NRO99369.1 phage virion morphogenesis protein [Paraburkholderia sp. NMBU_R16]
MGCAAVDDLSAFDAWAGALLAQLSPAGRRAAMRDIARELRRSQQARIAAQKNPDGVGYKPRKIKPGGTKLRSKRGRIKRTAMFMKLRMARWMTIEASERQLAVGFSGRVARVARVHQFGEKGPVAPGGPEYPYPVRMLLGSTDREREMIREKLLGHLME